MSNPLTISDSITIQAPASKVWDALVNPEQTKKYMFGCETVSDWQPGSSLLWQMVHEGKPFVAVKGDIVNIQPGRFLAYTTIDPNNPAMPDIPSNYLTVTYELTPQNGQTLLTVTQGDYATVADGENRYRHSLQGGGWMTILEKIKELVETGNLKAEA